jgi:hypothetical protein
VDSKSNEQETVHVTGANSPSVDGPRVTRFMGSQARASRPGPQTTNPAQVQRAEGDEVSEEGPPVALTVSGDVFTVWRVGGKSVRVRTEVGDTVDIKSDASIKAAVDALVGGDLRMDENQAKNLAAKLSASGMLTKQLLMQYLSDPPGGLDPETFGGKLMLEGTATTAAIGAPVGSSSKELLVDKGITEDQEQRPGPLTSIAHVFYPRFSGEWHSGQIQKDANLAGSKNIEFKFQGRGSPETAGLGLVEVDASGTIVRIVSVHPKNVVGGADAFKQIMIKAGWKVNIK